MYCNIEIDCVQFVIDTEDTNRSIKIEVFDEDPGEDDFLGRFVDQLSYCVVLCSV